MTAGGSAGLEAERQLARAAALEAEALAARERAENFMAASVSEKRTAEALAPLVAHGYHLLADRQWPGSRTAQVDLVVVGPSGVYIVDSKFWREVTIAAGHIFRGDADVTDEFDGLAELAWKTEAVLAEVGLAPGEVHAVAVFTGKKGVSGAVNTVELVGDADIARHIARRIGRLSPAMVETVLKAVLDFFPHVSAPAPISLTIPEPVLESTPVELDIAELPSADEIQAQLLDAMLAPPIEEWMAFLHPDQAKLVRRSFNGPARIRGAAGTGKTVVGLHRAAYLARSRPGKVLVTTYVRTLPTVLHGLIERMAPEVADRVEFVGVHQLAKRILDERGVTTRVDSRKAGDAFTAAWASAAPTLTAIEPSKAYWQEEVESVIKGRGFTRFEQYADCARVGRRRKLGVDQRRAVWELFRDYETRLRASRIHDFADLVLLAEQELAREPLEGYSAVVVDEAQDLSCAMVRMLWSIGGDGADAFTLIGDGQQTIYPGGYTLAEAGLSVAGRGVILDVNYRNTAEILEAAATVVASDGYTDIEDAAELRFEAARPVARHGRRPIRASYPNTAQHDAALVDRVRAVAASIDTSLGDVGVLCTNNGHVKRAMRLLENAGIPTVELTDYDGRPTDRVKVGTIQRAKGLEFKQVLLPWTDAALLAPRASRDADAASRDEKAERERRVLYVGMTRARDGLWVGSVLC
ncbi:nuclease-related domain-containing DEAD/DEAH box helicase [Protaetiibacter intestinalis]|uniref:DNA 3'-5' helicase n=1 Tax=Protaetiibacter intestinalis TaxID=2419774 RepID=A0A387B6U0_9MICO|nr:UvrD-helicase domain-containing protein [Protaetiibacter intestinalis]AYF96915.1 nuclease [Protaetiibacter intestinalis]